jgi:prepilin-type N-terminal cleavage/methylation domain-containing protein
MVVAQVLPNTGLRLHGCRGKRNPGRPAVAAKGFSLLELIAVISIIMILSAITVEVVQRATRTMRLQEAAVSYSNLLQQARIRAVRDDKYYSVLTTAGAGNVPPTAFVDLAQNGVYAAGDPVMIFPVGVSPMPFASGPNIVGLEAQFLPPGPGSLLTVNTTAAGPAFGTRGLPCTPTIAGPNATCPNLSPAGLPTAYISFMQNTQSGNWMAVTVTPAGRIRQWAYTGGNWTAQN